MKYLPISALLVGLMAVPALAQTTPGSAPPAVSQIPGEHLRAERMIDRDVYSTDNVEIGEVEDLIIDPAQGRVTMVVIELDRRYRQNHQYVTVPLDRLSLVPGERRVRINIASGDVGSLQGVNY